MMQRFRRQKVCEGRESWQEDGLCLLLLLSLVLLSMLLLVLLLLLLMLMMLLLLLLTVQHWASTHCWPGWEREDDESGQ